jgi:hypothetical protein
MSQKNHCDAQVVNPMVSDEALQLLVCVFSRRSVLPVCQHHLTKTQEAYRLPVKGSGLPSANGTGLVRTLRRTNAVPPTSSECVLWLGAAALRLLSPVIIASHSFVAPPLVRSSTTCRQCQGAAIEQRDTTIGVPGSVLVPGLTAELRVSGTESATEPWQWQHHDSDSLSDNYEVVCYEKTRSLA